MSKTALTCLAFFFMTNFSVEAQVHDFDWVHVAETNDFDVIHSIAPDAIGQSYIAGYFYDSITFIVNGIPETHVASGVADVYIAKVSNQGKFLWLNVYESPGLDFWPQISLKDDQLFITGQFQDSIDFNGLAAGGQHMSAGGNDIYMLSLDTTGAYLWSHQIESTQSLQSYHSEIDSKGNLYTHVLFTSTVDLNPGPGSSNASSPQGFDNALVILDKNGDFKEARVFAGNGADAFRRFRIDKDDNLYLLAYFSEDIQVDPLSSLVTLSAQANRDNFLAKYDSLGVLQWQRQFTSSTSNAMDNLAVIPNGGVALSGSFVDPIDFLFPSQTYSYSSSLVRFSLISRISAQGDLVWTRFKESDQAGYFIDDLTCNDQGDIFQIGRFRDTISFGTNGKSGVLTSRGLSDLFVQQIDSSNTFRWARQIGSDSFDFARALMSGPSGELFISGSFTLTADFDPYSGEELRTSGDDYDAFLTRWSPCVPDSIVTSIVACDSFYWSVSQERYHQTGLYWQKYTNQIGCDSFQVLELQVGYTTFDTIEIATCDSFYWAANNQMIDSSGFYPALLFSDLGCDSNVVLDLTLGYTSDTTWVDTIICDRFEVLDTTFMLSGNYVITTSNISGCDSVIILNLEVNKTPDASIIFDGFAGIQALDTVGPYKWLFSSIDTFLLEDTTASYEAHYDGRYAVIISRNNCADTSQYIVVDTFNIHGNIVSPAIIYPNPSDGNFAIDFGDGVDQMQIYDRLGRIIFQQGDLTDRKKFSIPLSSGIYQVLLFQNDEVIALPLVVTR